MQIGDRGAITPVDMLKNMYVLILTTETIIDAYENR